MKTNPALATRLATLATLADQVRGNGGNYPVVQRKIPLGQVIVELTAMRRKYSELEKNRAAFRAQIVTQRPGAYDGYKVVKVKEVTVKEHTRRSHNRLLLPR